MTEKQVIICKLDSKDLSRQDYEINEDCSKIQEEIVKIMKYDPIQKIKTSNSLLDVGEVLDFCREIAKSTICSNPNILIMPLPNLVLSGDVFFLLKVKIYAACKLKKLIISEAMRNSNYVRICKDKNIDFKALWKAIEKKKGVANF